MLTIAVFGCALVLVVTVSASFFAAHNARTSARRYLEVVKPLRIGTTHDDVAARLRNAGLPTTLSGDCHQECTLHFLVWDRWLYKLRLAPPVGLNGRLDFRNEMLVYKFTSLGQDPMVWVATVAEKASQGSLIAGTQDSSENIRHINVFLSASDFSEFRKKAYAFNVACIGSMRACKAVEYLPWQELERLYHEASPPN
jgi:hypothetical protein